MDKNTVIVYTCAYNSESVIERTIQSVLNQTHKNWIWHIVDNGCTDKTGEIIRRYAASDSRIIAHRNEKNYVWEKGNHQKEILSQYDDDLYWARIDADDEFYPECFEKVLAYGFEYKLDMIRYAYVCVDDKTGIQEQCYHTPKCLILNETEKAEKIFNLLTTSGGAVWGNVSKIRIIKANITSSYFAPNIGIDCISTVYKMCISKRIGVLPDVLYKYYIYDRSTMGQIFKDHNKNLEYYYGLFEVNLAYRNMLTDFKLINEKNNVWISEDYINICINIFKIIHLTDLIAEEKLSRIMQLLVSEDIVRIFSNTSVRYRVKHMFVSQAFHALKNISGWHNFPDGKYVMSELKKKRQTLKGYYLWQITRETVHFIRYIKNGGRAKLMH